jgi:hypothetical protein
MRHLRRGHNGLTAHAGLLRLVRGTTTRSIRMERTCQQVPESRASSSDSQRSSISRAMHQTARASKRLGLSSLAARQVSRIASASSMGEPTRAYGRRSETTPFQLGHTAAPFTFRVYQRAAKRRSSFTLVWQAVCAGNTPVTGLGSDPPALRWQGKGSVGWAPLALI